MKAEERAVSTWARGIRKFKRERREGGRERKVGEKGGVEEVVGRGDRANSNLFELVALPLCVRTSHVTDRLTNSSGSK